MTQEEKAKAYDRALEIAKAWCKLDNDDLCNADLETLFPELKESEDERIRNGLIALLKFSLEDGSAIAPGFNETKEQALAWLEKQGQQPKKVSIWKHWKDGIAGGAEGEQIFLTKIGRIYSISSCLGCECDYIELSELDSLLRDKQAPKPKWSEEDDYNVHCCIAKAESDIANGCLGRNKELIDWLKSLKQRMEGKV